jgi:hypothetical protein
METWYVKELGDSAEAMGPSSEISESFSPVFAAHSSPLDFAVFSWRDPQKNKVCLYFSPSAAPLAKAFNACPCDKPWRSGLGLLAGDVRSWDVLYPTK